MSHWNYRAMEFCQDSEVWQEIVEVFYDDDGKPNGYSCAAIMSNDNDLAGVLKMMGEALTKPMLKPEDCSRAIEGEVNARTE